MDKRAGLKTGKEMLRQAPTEGLEQHRERFEGLAHMFLCSSVMVGDSGMEARVGSWLTKELMLLLRECLQVLVRSLLLVKTIRFAQRQIGVDTGLPTRVS